MEANTNGTAPASEGAVTATPDFSAEQLQTMAGWAVADGSLTKEKADAMLAADGAGKIPDAVDPATAEYSKQFPTAAPHDYDIPALMDADAKTALAADKVSRQWLHAAGFDAGRGASLAREIGRVAAHTEKMSDSEREIYARTERARLERLPGWGDKTAEKIKMAGQLVRELEAKHPGVTDLLNKSGAGDSAMVINLIAAQAEILANHPRNKT